MPTLTAFAKDERTARQLLAVIGSPGDISTGALLSRVGAVEAIALIERDIAVPGMDAVESNRWCSARPHHERCQLRHESPLARRRSGSHCPRVGRGARP